MINIPKPPQNKSLDEVYRYCQEASHFLQVIHQNGLGCSGLTNDQMNALKNLNHAGKIVFNETEGDLYKSRVETQGQTKTLVWKKIAEAT